jgi:hypothetical protein
MLPFARMLANPCDATLIPGFNGTDEGILSRLKTTYTYPATANTNGYVLWCPTYVGGNGHMNCLAEFSNDSSGKTVNTVAAPLGSGGVSGFAIDVGATDFVLSSTVSDFRVVSACIRVTYTGALQASSGLIGYIENLPVDTFLLGQASLDECASTDDLLALCSKVTRLGVDTHESRYRPSGASLNTFKQDASGVYTLGVPATSRTTMTNESKRFAPTFHGFVFKGIDMDQLNFEFIQNIEWRPETRAGFVSVVPRQLKADGYKRQVAAWLDSNYPGWATAMAHTAGKYALRLATTAFSGVSPPMLTHVEL